MTEDGSTRGDVFFTVFSFCCESVVLFATSVSSRSHSDSNRRQSRRRALPKDDVSRRALPRTTTTSSSSFFSNGGFFAGSGGERRMNARLLRSKTPRVHRRHLFRKVFRMMQRYHIEKEWNEEDTG